MSDITYQPLIPKAPNPRHYRSHSVLSMNDSEIARYVVKRLLHREPSANKGRYSSTAQLGGDPSPLDYGRRAGKSKEERVTSRGRQ
jgi:hypothetical protein